MGSAIAIAKPAAPPAGASPQTHYSLRELSQRTGLAFQLLRAVAIIYRVPRVRVSPRREVFDADGLDKLAAALGDYEQRARDQGVPCGLPRGVGIRQKLRSLAS